VNEVDVGLMLGRLQSLEVELEHAIDHIGSGHTATAHKLLKASLESTKRVLNRVDTPDTD
jgi:hypothetical protein